MSNTNERPRARTATSGSERGNGGGAISLRWMPATRRLVAVAVSRLVRFFSSSSSGFIRLSKPMRKYRIEVSQDADGDMVYLCPVRDRLCVMDWGVGFRLGKDRLKHPESDPPQPVTTGGPAPHNSQNEQHRQDHLDARPATQCE